MAEIGAGAKVLARDAKDRWLEKRALTGVTSGRDFEVVIVCTEAEWEAAQAEGREPDGVAWPAEDVKIAQPTPA